MNKIIKTITLACLMLCALLLLVACAEPSQYDEYDQEGYNVSIKYDANGGMFHTNVETIVDTYNMSEIPEKADGKKELALIAPDNPIRGTENAYKPNNAGYFLAGWYTERTPVLDEQGRQLDADGNVAAKSGKAPAYTYAGRWDFENGRLALDPNKEYTASEAALTLYAAWIPEFKYEFYSLGTGELISEYLFDPNYVSEIRLPQWSEETGKLNMEKFPSVTDKTLLGVYLDAAGTVAAEGSTVVHTGSYNPADATAEGPVMKLYLDYAEGEWFHIYTAKQFLDNFKVGGCYEICADLDFTGLSWKTSLLHGNFRGKILGNGHTFSNITIEQTDTKKQNSGMFGAITADATLSDITFDNVILTIASGTLQPDASFGLLAGTLDAEAAVENVVIQNSKLLIHANANLLDSTAIGRVCGNGSTHGIDPEGILCEATGENASDIIVEVNGNDVSVRMAP